MGEGWWDLGTNRGHAKKLAIKLESPKKVWLAYKGGRLKNTFPIHCVCGFDLWCDDLAGDHDWFNTAQ